MLQGNFGVVFLGVFGVVIALILAYGIFVGDFLNSISDPAQARGLITFLFSFSTIAMFVLIGIATFWMDRDEIKDRFALAKDLITLMIGVLGTILGFYFGSISNEDKGFFVANVSSPGEAIASKQSVDISAMIVGGKAPYAYEVTFTDLTGTVPVDGLAKKGDSPDGVIKVSISIPEVKKPGSVSFTILAKDAKGAQARTVGTLFVKPAEPPPAPSPPAPPSALPSK